VRGANVHLRSASLMLCSAGVRVMSVHAYILSGHRLWTRAAHGVEVEAGGVASGMRVLKARSVGGEELGHHALLLDLVVACAAHVHDSMKVAGVADTRGMLKHARCALRTSESAACQH
jgi:hypothetical protein